MNKLIYLFQNIVRAVSYLTNRNFNESKFIEKLLTDNSVIIDVGSNVGSYIKFISKKNKNKNLTIFSIEALEKNCNIQNQLKFPKNHTVNIHNLAITDNNLKEVIIYENYISSQSSLILNKSDDINIKNEINVKSMKLNQFIEKNQIEKIDLLKIDTEGMDFRIIFSIENILKKGIIQYIKLEIFTENFEVIEFLGKYGYRFVNFNNVVYKDNEVLLFDAYFAKT